MGINIERLGDTYVNVNSRDRRKRENRREKQLFEKTA